MSRILMLLFSPYSPDPRVQQEANSLTKAGHEVTIISWHRNLKSAKVLEDDFSIKHLGPPLPQNFSNQKVGIQMALKLWAWVVFSFQAIDMARREEPDIIHAHDLDTLPLGIILSKLMGISVIYDSHEIYSQMIEKDMPGAGRFLEWAEKRMVLHADRIITVTPNHKEYFESMGAEDIGVVTNCKPVEESEYIKPENDKFTLIYIGVFNRTRFLHEAIEICGNIDGVELIIAGFGQMAEELERKAAQAPKGNVKFIGRIPGREVIPRTREADAVLCMLDPGNYNNRVGPPNKLFEAMVAGRPVIATKDTYSGQVVQKEEMGLAVEYSPKAFKTAVIQLRDNPVAREEYGRRALKTAVTKYNWDIEARKLLTVYETI